MHRLAEQFARFLFGPGRKEFEEHRQVIRKFLGADLEALGFIHRHQVDHGLAAIAALAVHVLEQMQRQHARAVEQEDVALLRVIEIEAGNVVGQHAEKSLLALADSRVVGKRRLQLRHCLKQLLSRIREEERDHFQRNVHRRAPQKTSVGVCTVFLRLAPNRSTVELPPEQPLPKEKPQEPRTS